MPMPDTKKPTDDTAQNPSDAVQDKTSPDRELERPETVPAHLQPEPETALHKTIVEALRGIYDPEIPVNIYDLGLIYNIDIHDDNHVDVLMTLTAPNCPAAGILPGQAEDAVRFVDGVESVYLELTFDPPFSPEMMSEEAQLELGFM